MKKGKFIKFASRSFVGGKNIALYDHKSDAEKVVAVVETIGSKRLGSSVMRRADFDAPLSLSALAREIEIITNSRVSF